MKRLIKIILGLTVLALIGCAYRKKVTTTTTTTTDIIVLKKDTIK